MNLRWLLDEGPDLLPFTYYRLLITKTRDSIKRPESFVTLFSAG